jgi:hypothetical protein
MAQMRSALFMVAIAATAFGCDDLGGLCGNTELTRSRSPDGTKEVVLFERDCGAMTHTYIHVSVVSVGERVKGAGNAFTADSNHQQAPVDVRLQWESPHKLRLSYATSARVFQRTDRIGDTDVVYVTVPQ